MYNFYKKNFKFVQSRDSCERIEQKPVYEISIKDGKLWPLVVVEQVRFIFFFLYTNNNFIFWLSLWSELDCEFYIVLCFDKIILDIF
jgi:hypothetical protein